MADDNSTSQSEIDKLLARVDEAINSHKNATKDELAALTRNLRDELAAAKKETSDLTAATIKELQDGLKDVMDFVAGQREAEKQKNRVQENESTIVVPPNDVTPPAPTQPEEQSYSQEGGEDRKKSILKRMW